MTSAPPELPGLIAAEVWIALVTTGLEAVCCCWVPGSWPCWPCGLSGLGRDRAVERADDAGGDGAGEAERVADGHDRVADDDLRRSRRWTIGTRSLGGFFSSDDGEVGRRVGADDLGVVGAAVGRA